MVCESVYTSGAGISLSGPHALQLGLGHALGVADDPALRAAVGNVHRRGLPRHPRGQRLHFVQRDVGVVADAALRRPARHVVLHPKAGEHLHLPVVHLRGDGGFQDALWRAQNLPESEIELQVFRGHIELNLRDAERIQIFARGNPGHHRLGLRFHGRGHWRFSSTHRLVASCMGACFRATHSPARADTFSSVFLWGVQLHTKRSPCTASPRVVSRVYSTGKSYVNQNIDFERIRLSTRKRPGKVLSR